MEVKSGRLLWITKFSIHKNVRIFYYSFCWKGLYEIHDLFIFNELTCLMMTSSIKRRSKYHPDSPKRVQLSNSNEMICLEQWTFVLSVFHHHSKKLSKLKLNPKQFNLKQSVEFSCTQKPAKLRALQLPWNPWYSNFTDLKRIYFPSELTLVSYPPLETIFCKNWDITFQFLLHRLSSSPWWRPLHLPVYLGPRKHIVQRKVNKWLFDWLNRCLHWHTTLDMSM